MKQCVMCHKEFEDKDLDFLGRCEPCFKDYVQKPEAERPPMGIPFTPISKAVK